MKKEENDNQILKEIRDLLILISAKVGATNEDVAKVLDCGKSTLRKKVSFAGEKKCQMKILEK